jgi:hypothetical protein
MANSEKLPGAMPDRLPETARAPADFDPRMLAKTPLRATRVAAKRGAVAHMNADHADATFALCDEAARRGGRSVAPLGTRSGRRRSKRRRRALAHGGTSCTGSPMSYSTRTLPVRERTMGRKTWRSSVVLHRTSCECI